MPDALRMIAGECLVMRAGDGTVAHPEAPAMFSPGAGHAIGDRLPDDDCALWVLEWRDGAVALVCIPLAYHPEPQALYEMTFSNPRSLSSMWPANRLAI